MSNEIKQFNSENVGVVVDMHVFRQNHPFDRQGNPRLAVSYTFSGEQNHLLDPEIGTADVYDFCDGSKLSPETVAIAADIQSHEITEGKTGTIRRSVASVIGEKVASALVATAVESFGPHASFNVKNQTGKEEKTEL